jgi:hypothetical protein
MVDSSGDRNSHDLDYEAPQTRQKRPFWPTRPIMLYLIVGIGALIVNLCGSQQRRNAPPATPLPATTSPATSRP